MHMNEYRLIFGFGIVAGLIGGILSSFILQSTFVTAEEIAPIPKTLIAQELHLVDSSGDIFFKVYTDKEGTPFFDMYNKDHSGRLMARIDKDETVLDILRGRLFSSTGLMLRASQNTGGHVTLYGKFPSVSVLEGSVGTHFVEPRGAYIMPRDIQLTDKKGNVRASLFLDPYGDLPNLTLFDENGHKRTKFGFLELKNERTGVETNYPYSLGFFDQQGRILSKHP